MRRKKLSRQLEQLVPWQAAIVLLAVLAMPATGQGKCYIGAYIEQDPVVAGDIALFERLVGKEHSSYMRYLGYGEPFPTDWVAKVHNHGALPHIAWEPNNGLDEVRDDVYLRRWAQAAAEAQKPILLRFASEMNGTWMPYSGNPDEYVRKWRLVYTTIKSQAPNVIMVWCPFATPRRTIPLYYPGDDYVDWVGVNIYAVLYHDGDISQPAQRDLVDDLRYVCSLYGARKPIAICEYGATHYCRASQQFSSSFAAASIEQVYQAIREQFPGVVFINWFSVDAASDGLAYNDYAVTTDNLVLSSYRQAIDEQYFLTQLPTSLQVALAALWQPHESSPPQTTTALALTGTSRLANDQLAIVVRGGQPEAVTGSVVIEARAGSGLDVNLVEFYLNGQILALTNVPPYRVRWNAAAGTPGEHIIRVVARNSADQKIAVEEATVIVAESETD